MTPEFKVDFERGTRIGLDEALFCEGKTVDQISAIVDAVKARSGRLLLTRLDGQKHQALVARNCAELEFDPLSRTAILGQPHSALLTAPVAIVMAGTSDLPVGREAARTLAFAGQPYREYTDVGVAGLWASSNGSMISDRLPLSSWRRAWTRRSSASSAVWFPAR
jgi:pyridinium-3,5-biscarboxylic acid mononucleotide synthase